MNGDAEVKNGPITLGDLLRGMLEYERAVYNFYKLGETFSTFEGTGFVDAFMLMAEEELRHMRTIEEILEGDLNVEVDYIDALSISSAASYRPESPHDFSDLVLEALKLEKYAYEVYMKLSEILSGSLSQIFRMMATEELAHAYRLKLMYEEGCGESGAGRMDG